jgi:hypothetical protein
MALFVSGSSGHDKGNWGSRMFRREVDGMDLHICMHMLMHGYVGLWPILIVPSYRGVVVY